MDIKKSININVDQLHTLSQLLKHKTISNFNYILPRLILTSVEDYYSYVLLYKDQNFFSNKSSYKIRRFQSKQQNPIKNCLREYNATSVLTNANQTPMITIFAISIGSASLLFLQSLLASVEQFTANEPCSLGQSQGDHELICSLPLTKLLQMLQYY